VTEHCWATGLSLSGRYKERLCDVKKVARMTLLYTILGLLLGLFFVCCTVEQYFLSIFVLADACNHLYVHCLAS